MSRVTELEAELTRANTRIAELEKYYRERPITIRQMKEEIGRAIGADFSESYSYGTTVSRGDLVKIHAWIMEKVSGRKVK